MERCSICRQLRWIAKRLKRGVDGSAMKFRSVLVCGDCDKKNTEEYTISQRRYAQEQVALIEAVIAEYPESKSKMQPYLADWRAKAQ